MGKSVLCFVCLQHIGARLDDHIGDKVNNNCDTHSCCGCATAVRNVGHELMFAFSHELKLISLCTRKWIGRLCLLSWEEAGCFSFRLTINDVKSPILKETETNRLPEPQTLFKVAEQATYQLRLHISGRKKKSQQWNEILTLMSNVYP